MMKLILAFILGSVVTYWVHPFADVATYVEVQKQEIKIRSDNYQKCKVVGSALNGRGLPESEWKCKNGDVFYTTSEYRTYFKEKE